MVRLYEDLSSEARQEFKNRIQTIVEGRAGTAGGQGGKLLLVVSGGVPPRQFEHTLEVDPAGTVLVASRDSDQATSERRGSVDQAVVQRLFAGALEMLDLSGQPDTGLDPDSVVATLILSDGDAVQILNFAVAPEPVTRPVPTAVARGLVLLPNRRLVRLEPLFRSLAEAEGASEGGRATP